MHIAGDPGVCVDCMVDESQKTARASTGDSAMSTPQQMTLFGPAGYAGQIERQRVEPARPAAVRDASGRFVSSEICGKCDGSGKFYFRGSVVNGVFTGKVGMCFACKGKGRQTPADVRRNDTYWAHASVSPF